MSKVQDSTGWVNNAVEILETKAGGFQINVKKDLTLEKGRRIILKKFDDHLAQLVEKGIISEDDAHTRLAKQSFVKYVGTVAPMKEEDDSNF